MDAYDDCGSWFPEQNSPVSRRLDVTQQLQQPYQFFDRHLHQQQSQFSTAFHHHQQQQQRRQQRSQCASAVGSANSSGLNSPSSGYCSADDSEKVGLGSFTGTGAGASPFSAAAAAATVGGSRLYRSPPQYGSGELPIYSPTTTSTSTGTCYERHQSPVGDCTGKACSWRGPSPSRVITASGDPCLGQQIVATPQHQRHQRQFQQQQQPLQQPAGITSTSSASPFCASSMQQEFFDDYSSTWSGGIGMDEFEAFWDPFGASATSGSIDRLVGSDYWNCEMIASTSSPERMDVISGSSALPTTTTSPLSTFQSSTTTTQNHFRQCHAAGKSSAPASAMSCASYVPTNAADYLTAGFSNQNSVSPAGRPASRRDDGSSVDFGFTLSTSALGEASLGDVVRSSCSYAVQSSASSNCGSSPPTASALFQVGSPATGDFAVPITSGSVQREAFSAASAGAQLQHGYKSSPALVSSCNAADGSGSVAGYHLQHMAADLATGCDISDFELLPTYPRQLEPSGSVQPSASALARHRHSSTGGELQIHQQQQQQLGSGLLGGMFSQRNPLRSCSETGKAAFAAASAMGGSASARSRGVAVAKSCGSLLQLAPPYGPVNGNPTPVVQVRGTNGSASGRNRTGSCNGIVPRVGCNRGGDVRGGRSPYQTSASVANCCSTLYPGLDDHRYTTRSMPYSTTGSGSSAPPPTKVQKTGRGANGSRSTAGGSGRTGSAAPASGLIHSGSILEAFLRSSRPIDPNKGSNAALAAEGLFNLHIGDSSPRKHRSRASSAATSDNDDNDDANINDGDGEDDDDTSGTLLKKLLTSNIDRLDGRRTTGNRSPSHRRHGIGNRSASDSKGKLRKMTIEEERHPAPVAQQQQATKMPAENDSSASAMMSMMMMQPCGNDVIDADTKTLIANGFGLTVLSGSGSPDSGNGVLGVDMDLSLLDDPNNMALFGLIDEDVDDHMWSSAAPSLTNCFDFDDKLLQESNELDDTLREESRHEQLWLQQYFADDVIDESSPMQSTKLQSAATVGGAL